MPMMPPLMTSDGPAWMDTSVLPVNISLDWNNPADRRIIRRDARRKKRAERQAQRQPIIASNQRAFSGRVEIGEELNALVATAKEVVTSHGRYARRATFSGALTCDDHIYRGHFVILRDARSFFKETCAEIVWTGKDWRLHIWRASRGNDQISVPLDIVQEQVSQ